MLDFQELFIRSSEFYDGEVSTQITEKEMSAVLEEIKRLAITAEANVKDLKMLFGILAHYHKTVELQQCIKAISNRCALDAYNQVMKEYYEDLELRNSQTNGT